MRPPVTGVQMMMRLISQQRSVERDVISTASFAVIFVVVIASCNAKSESSSRRHRSDNVDRPTVRSSSPDSANAVDLARQALSGGTLPLRLESYQHIGDVYRISLIPSPPAGYVTVGGGGLVEIRQGGRVRVLERYR